MFTVKARRKSLISSGLGSMFRALRGPTSVKVGFPAGKTDQDVLERAIFNHFGTRSGIPERPFLTNAMRDNQGKYRRQMQAGAGSILKAAVLGKDAGKKTHQVLAKLGVEAQGDIQLEITALASPPNASSTIRQKGSSNPLIDSGEMRKAVTWKIGDD